MGRIFERSHIKILIRKKLIFLFNLMIFFLKISKVIHDMGCKDIFDQTKANFSNLIDPEKLQTRSFFIDKFFTMSSIDMFDKNSFKLADEKQVATSKIGMAPLEFNCNKPFLFVIHDNVFDNILFIGRYVKPVV